MLTTPTDAERRHHAAIIRAARMGGVLARHVRAALASCLDELPDQPGPHDLIRLRSHVEAVTTRLAAVLSDRLRTMLLAAAEREHWLTAVALTRAARRGNVQEGWRDYFKLLIPAPAREFLERIVGATHRFLTRLIDPQRASNVVLQGVSSGKNRKQIVADLTDAFGGYEAAARRVARTEGLRVAVSTQLAVSEDVPELVAGYSVYSVLDDRVRPEHRKRHGFKYYRNPKKGQRGMDEMPRPPLEADGSLAHNCRCGLLPIILIDGEEV